MTSDIEKQRMQFRYGDRELQLGTDNLLAMRVDAIVSPASSDLSHSKGLARQIIEAAGEEPGSELRQLIREYGRIDSGMAVFTRAGRLPCQAIVHAVGPQPDEEDRQRKIEQAVSRSLLLCEANEWKSIAFPAIGVDTEDTIQHSAQAFFRAITSFWDARNDCSVEKIVLCLTQAQFRPFFDAFREDAITPEPIPLTEEAVEKEEVVGVIDLDEADLPELDDDEIAGWFK